MKGIRTVRRATGSLGARSALTGDTSTSTTQGHSAADIRVALNASIPHEYWKSASMAGAPHSSGTHIPLEQDRKGGATTVLTDYTKSGDQSAHTIINTILARIKGHRVTPLLGTYWNTASHYILRSTEIIKSVTTWHGCDRATRIARSCMYLGTICPANSQILILDATGRKHQDARREHNCNRAMWPRSLGTLILILRRHGEPARMSRPLKDTKCVDSGHVIRAKELRTKRIS